MRLCTVAAIDYEVRVLYECTLGFITPRCWGSH
jgi:hypothetical protein